MDDRGAYLPSQQQIAAACATIQGTWSDDERRRRACGLMPGARSARGVTLPPAWQPPVIAVTPEVAAALEAM
ncbi:MAG: hypothetical protein DCC67_11515 [Planctomycetota bacterium]|nr:MAG: hypothetical protein DCC67_11515 [Planctomycetota bacterium]